MADWPNRLATGACARQRQAVRIRVAGRHLRCRESRSGAQPGPVQAESMRLARSQISAGSAVARVYIGRSPSERLGTSAAHQCQTLIEGMAAALREMNDQSQSRVDGSRQLVKFGLLANHQRSPLDPWRTPGTANGEQFANLLEAEPTAA